MKSDISRSHKPFDPHYHAFAQRLLGIIENHHQTVTPTQYQQQRHQQLARMQPQLLIGTHGRREEGRGAVATTVAPRSHSNKSRRASAPTTSSAALHRCFASAAELTENVDWVRLVIDLPGVEARDLDVNIEHRKPRSRSGRVGSTKIAILSVVGTRKTMSVDRTQCLRSHKFYRRYAINADVVDTTSATATLSSGVLTFVAPKKKRNKNRKHSVEESAVAADSQLRRLEKVPVSRGGEHEMTIRMTTTAGLLDHRHHQPRFVPEDSSTDDDEERDVRSSSRSTHHHKPIKKRAFDSM